MSYDCPSWNKYTSCVKWTRVWAKSVKRLLGQVEKAKKVSSSGGWTPKLVLKWQIDAKTSASLPRQTHTCDSFTGIRNILCLPYSSHNTAMEVPPLPIRIKHLSLWSLQRSQESRTLSQKDIGHQMHVGPAHSPAIHSKSEDPEPKNPVNFFEFSANLSKNATK